MSVADSSSITVGSSATPDNNFKFLIDDLGGMTLKSGGEARTILTISATGAVSPIQAPTASAPIYVKGAMYFDTTLNKLRIGGATAWETVTSA